MTPAETKSSRTTWPNEKPRAWTVGTQAKIAGTRVLALAGSFASNFFMAGAVVRHYGIEQYGYVMLLGSIPALLPFASMGVTAPIINRFAVDSGNDEAEEALRATLRAASRVLTRASLTLLAAWVLISTFSFWSRLLGMPQVQEKQIGVVVLLIVTCVCTALFGGMGSAALVGMGRNLEAVRLQSIQPLVVFAGTAALLVCQVAPLYFAILFSLGQATAATFMLRAANRRSDCKFLRTMWEGALHQGPVESIRAEAGPMAVIQMSRAVGLQSDRLVLSHRSDALALGQYSVIAQMYQAALSIVTSLALSLWPSFRARPVNADARSVLVRTSAAFALMGVILGGGLVLLGPWAYHAVTQVNPPSTTVFSIFAALLIATSALQPVSMYLTNRRGLFIQAVATSSVQVVNLALSWWLAAPWGVTGVVLASAVCIGLLLPLPLLWELARLSRSERVG
jgi:O-antigen/teichoic acid export membrane protein